MGFGWEQKLIIKCGKNLDDSTIYTWYIFNSVTTVMKYICQLFHS